ncbi:MAG TPA: DegV family protein, partial [Aggregatilineales bacterium]|nr:DegV family protein [Aggregatilineales bacterium]
MAKIHLVTDSALDVPAALLEKHKIGLVPAFINFGLESIPDDGKAITIEEFFRRMETASPLPTTSAPPPGVAEEVLRAAIAGADRVLAIHVSGKLSSLIEAVRIAAQSVDPERITVYDTESVSMGGGWQTITAAEMAADGADIAAITAALDALKPRLKLWAAPTTLDYLRRSGRVNAMVASLGEMLQIKPMITVRDGEIVLQGRVRTFKKVFTELERLCREFAPIQRLAVLHMNAPENGEKMYEILKDIAPVDDETLFVNASAAIGVHFGPGGLALATVR